MANVNMPAVDALRETFPETARDIKLNLSSIAGSEHLEAEQIFGIALASASYLGMPRLRDAVLADAQAAGVSADLIEDAQAAVALMGMNTVYYRFRHLVGKESYGQKPARLRMQWMAKPKTGKANFELFSLAVAAIEGCEMCIRAHEASIRQHGLGEEHVHDAVRIAAVLAGAAAVLRLS